MLSEITRRRFGFSLCAAGLARPLGAAGQPEPWAEPAEVRKVYLAAPRVHWPRPDLDIAKDVAEVDARLAEVERRHPALIRFTGGELLRTGAEVEPWLKRLGDADAAIILPLSAPMGALTALVDRLSVPALYFSRPYAGHSWAAIADLRKGGRKIDAIATSSYGDLDAYAPIFQTIRHLRKSRVLVVGRNREKTAEAFTRQFGTGMTFLGYPDLRAAFEAADAENARRAGDEFARAALRVVEPKPREIHDALRFYAGASQLLRAHRANAITVDCFGGLLAKEMPAYPCIAWSKLNDEGNYGVCEGDLHSTLTQMLVTACTGMPGFVSDPVFDLSRDEVIHAHCVAATRMHGLRAPASPYILRDHLETKEGAVLQVLMPSGETITVARLAAPNRMLLSTAEVTGNVESDRGCRSQIRTRVAGARKMFENYTGGLHRVIFYGDHVAAIERMGRLMGFHVVREA